MKPIYAECLSQAKVDLAELTRELAEMEIRRKQLGRVIWTLASLLDVPHELPGDILARYVTQARPTRLVTGKRGRPRKVVA